MTTRVPCGDYCSSSATRRCSRTPPRSTPDGFWFVCPRDLQREVWPTEDYHLARSLVDVELPEDDLFTGVHVEVAADTVSHWACH
ncbi:hypothetical protein GCM10018952_75410 [Streptosporangium vulgare]